MWSTSLPAAALMTSSSRSARMGYFSSANCSSSTLCTVAPARLRELFGNVAALQARHNVKTIWPDNAGHLLDRDICISAEIRNVSGILLVGKDETNSVTMMLQRLVGAANTRLELLKRSHVLAVNRRAYPAERARPCPSPCGVLRKVVESSLKFGLVSLVRICFLEAAIAEYQPSCD